MIKTIVHSFNQRTQEVVLLDMDRNEYTTHVLVDAVVKHGDYIIGQAVSAMFFDMDFAAWQQYEDDTEEDMLSYFEGH